MKKELIFDLDGTLLNTIFDIADAMNYALDVYNYPPNTDEDYVKYIGDGIYELVVRAIHNPNVDEKTVLEILKIYENRYHQISCNRTRPFDNMKEVLLELKRRGYELSVISNKPDYDSNILINYFFPKIFKYVVGSKADVARKPSTMPMDIFLKKYNLTKDDIIYIGDSRVDARFSENIGCEYYLFEHGYENKQLLHSFNPKAFLKNAKDLLDVLK